jgi:NADH:ubiquinone oxidoreductase subunit K
MKPSKACLATLIAFGLLLTSFSLSLVAAGNGAVFADTTLSEAPNGSTDSDFVILETNSTISEPAFNRTTHEVTFNVTGPTGTQDFVWCKIAENLIPHQDASKNLKVLLDGNQINYMYSFNDGAWQLFFNYTHSTHQITISLPNQNATIFGIDRLTFVVAFVVACVAVGTIIVVWRRNHKPTAAQ